MIKFDAAVLIMPGLGNSGDHHWQTLWENKFGFPRVQQDNWDTPVKTEWLARVDDYVKKKNKFLPKISKWISEHGGGPMIPYSADFETKVTSVGTDPEVRKKAAEELGAPSCISRIIKVGY